MTLLDKLTMELEVKAVGTTEATKKVTKSLSEFDQSLKDLGIRQKHIFTGDIVKEASERFDLLVKKGIAKKRGNNLLSISDAHLYRVSINDFKDDAQIIE